MRNFLVFVFSLCVCVSFGQYKGDSWAKVKSSGTGTLTVVYYEQPGLIFEEGGKMKGLCVDVISDFVGFVQTKYNKKITVNYAGKEPVFTDFLKVAQNTKDILGVTNVNINEDRKKILKFTPAFLSNPVLLLTHKDAPALTSISEISTKFSGYEAIVIEGSSHLKNMEKIKTTYIPALKINKEANGSDVMKKLIANPKLFTILDFSDYIEATRKNQPIKRQNVNFGDAEEVGFIMSKQSDWDEVWKEFLTPDYRKSVRYRKIIADNLGATMLSLIK
jgi:membrane-bound lytic murein transglycosylase MltF